MLCPNRNRLVSGVVVACSVSFTAQKAVLLARVGFPPNVYRLRYDPPRLNFMKPSVPTPRGEVPQRAVRRSGPGPAAREPRLAGADRVRRKREQRKRSRAGRRGSGLSCRRGWCFGLELICYRKLSQGHKPPNHQVRLT